MKNKGDPYDSILENIIVNIKKYIGQATHLIISRGFLNISIFKIFSLSKYLYAENLHVLKANNSCHLSCIIIRKLPI